MRKILAATLLAAVSSTVTPASAGCAEDYLIYQDPGPEPVLVTRNPDGSITVHPPTTTVFRDLAVLIVRTNAFVDCAV